MSDETKAENTPAPQAEQVAQASTKSDMSKEEKKAKNKAAEDEFNAATTVHVKIYSPYRNYYDEDAESISAENLTGPFDILPRHHNFITLLVPSEITIRSSKTGDKKVRIARGIMHVRKNRVTVFLDV